METGGFKGVGDLPKKPFKSFEKFQSSKTF